MAASGLLKVYCKKAVKSLKVFVKVKEVTSERIFSDTC